MKYTVTQRVVCKEDSRVDYIRYFLEGEKEDEVLKLFKEKLLPRHFKKDSEYENWVSWGEPMIREYAESDEYTGRIELEREAGNVIIRHYYHDSEINVSLAVIQILTAIFSVASLVIGIIRLLL